MFYPTLNGSETFQLNSEIKAEKSSDNQIGRSRLCNTATLSRFVLNLKNRIHKKSAHKQPNTYLFYTYFHVLPVGMGLVM